MDPSTVYAEIESAKTKGEFYAALDRMSRLTESERWLLAELVAQRRAEFSKETE